MSMPAGTYWIGDLCYVMHAEWEEVCDITIEGHNCLDGEFTLADGRRFATYGTAFGDGEYVSNTGHTLGVDAGLIGCILLSDIDTSNTENRVELGMIHVFDVPFETEEEDGTIVFGDVYVPTKWDGNDGDEWGADDNWGDDE